MKNSIIGKLLSLFILVLLSQTSLFGSVRYHVTFYSSEDKTKVDNALDAALTAYNSAKLKLDDIEAYNGTDPQKLALRDQAQSLQTQLKKKYDKTVDTAKDSVRTTNYVAYNLFTDDDYTDYTYNQVEVKKTEDLSKEVVDLGSQASVLSCQFNGRTWANGVCTQSSGGSSSSSGSSNNDTVTTLQETMTDNVQNIINNIQTQTTQECHVYGAFGECLY